MNLPTEFPRDVEAFACDLDRTILPESGRLSERTVASVRAAQTAGVRVVVVTGRMFRSVRPYLEQLGLEGPVVCYQGAVVAEPGGRFLRHEPIAVELARETIAAVVAEGYGPNCYVDDELYVDSVTAHSRAYAEFQHIPVHEVGDLEAWLEKPPTKLVCVGDPVALDGLEARMKARFDGRLFISKSLPHFLEFASPDVTKGTGLRFAAEHVGFSTERTVAFGDGENDVELLQCAGYAVAVANAHDRVLAAADFVCPRDSEDGVAQVIEAYLDSSR